MRPQDLSLEVTSFRIKHFCFKGSPKNGGYNEFSSVIDVLVSMKLSGIFSLNKIPPM